MTHIDYPHKLIHQYFKERLLLIAQKQKNIVETQNCVIKK